jgi:putative endonuclease
MKQYFVYILTNFTNKVLYVGITNNLVRRIYEHKQKLVGGFTKRYNVSKLVYYEIFEDPENAIMREKTLKNLLRSKKISLIQIQNPNFEEIVI